MREYFDIKTKLLQEQIPMKMYDIYGIGAAIVDIEVVVTDYFLRKINRPRNSS